MDPRVLQLHLSRGLSLLSILKCVFHPFTTPRRRSAFVFSPCGEQEHTISTPQISAHTVSLLSYTPVTIHQFAITHTPFLCPPAATVVYALCPDESLSTAFHCGATPGRQSVCVCVCRLCVFFLPPAWSDHQPWTMNCSDKLSVSRSAKWSQSV